jgi:hypothetical protein
MRRALPFPPIIRIADDDRFLDITRTKASFRYEGIMPGAPACVVDNFVFRVSASSAGPTREWSGFIFLYGRGLLT